MCVGCNGSVEDQWACGLFFLKSYVCVATTNFLFLTWGQFSLVGSFSFGVL